MQTNSTLRASVFALVLILALAVAPIAQAAIITLDFASFGSGAVVINFDYNQGNGNILRFRCINNSQYDAWFGVYDVDPNSGLETLLGERYCLAGQTIEQNVPGVSVAWDLVDGGLIMGDYQFRARWPAN